MGRGMLGAADVELLEAELGGRVASRLWLGDRIDYVTCGNLTDSRPVGTVKSQADRPVCPRAAR